MSKTIKSTKTTKSAKKQSGIKVFICIGNKKYKAKPYQYDAAIMAMSHYGNGINKTVYEYRKNGITFRLAPNLS